MSLKLGTTSIPGIRVVEEGGSSSSTSDYGVMFIDYDGTVIEQWAPSEVAGKSALPSNPTHAGLTAQGWNWTLANIKTQMALSNKQMIVVGQQYVTTSEATEIDIEIVDSILLSIYISFAVNGGVSIDWGDNSSPTTLTGTSLTVRKYTNHTYSSLGNYTIKISVTSGSMGFYFGSGSYYLISDTYGSSSYQLGYVSMVKAIRTGKNFVSIGNYTLQYLGELEYITLSKAVTSIGTYAFQYCCKLKSITIPETITLLDNNTFYYCTSLKSVSLPYSIEQINNNVFYCNYKLAHITLSNSLTTLGSSAFYYCASFKSLYIPSSITVLNNGTFGNCKFLKAVIIGGSNLTSIGDTCFSNCSALEEINLPSSITSIGNSAFSDCLLLASNLSLSCNFGNNVFKGCYSLTNITISGSNLTLGTGMFNTSFLKNITLSGITSIPSDTFNSCYYLSSITIPNTVTTIGSNAFQKCYTLVSLTIPNSVTSIATKAFQNCLSMREYHFQSTTPPELEADALSGMMTNCKIYVPSASLSAYQSATNWSNYASKMVGE